MLIIFICADIWQLHSHYLHDFLDYFHTLNQCDVANVIANDVTKRWRGCDVVITMSSEADCFLRTS